MYDSTSLLRYVVSQCHSCNLLQIYSNHMIHNIIPVTQTIIIIIFTPEPTNQVAVALLSISSTLGTPVLNNFISIIVGIYLTLRRSLGPCGIQTVKWLGFPSFSHTHTHTHTHTHCMLAVHHHPHMQPYNIICPRNLCGRNQKRNTNTTHNTLNNTFNIALSYY